MRVVSCIWRNTYGGGGLGALMSLNPTHIHGIFIGLDQPTSVKHTSSLVIVPLVPWKYNAFIKNIYVDRFSIFFLQQNDG